MSFLQSVSSFAPKQRQMISMHRQKGIGMVTALLYFAVFCFVFLCVSRMVPAYNDNQYVKTGMKSLAKNHGDFDKMDRGEIQQALSKFMQLNGVRNPEATKFEILRLSEKTVVNNNYEIRVPIVGNVDVVMKFANQLDSSNTQKCCEYLIPDEKKPKAD